MDTDKLIKSLFKLKERRGELQREFEAKDAELEATQDKIETALQNILKENGLDNASISDNEFKYTVTRSIKARMWPGDWDAFRAFELANPDFDFREKRIHQGNLKAFMDEHPDEAPPINIDRKYVITTRRTKK